MPVKSAFLPETKLNIVMAQTTPIVGAVEYNFNLAVECYQKAQAQQADIIVFSELFLSGYPPEDLILKPIFLQKCQESLLKLVKLTEKHSCAIIIGAPYQEGENCYNGAFFLANGKILAKHYKNFLPNYNEFDEKRVFSNSSGFSVFYYRGHILAMVICEDIWQDALLGKTLKEQNAEMLFVINGSPYTRTKDSARKALCKDLATSGQFPVFYVNQVGGQDHLVFDGGSFITDCEGNIIEQLSYFVPEIKLTCWTKNNKTFSWSFSTKENTKACLYSALASDYQAILLALRDYVTKNGFSQVLLGLSGGIDSALCLALAVDALGSEAVEAVMLPSVYTSQASLEDAQKCVNYQRCAYKTFSIEDSFNSIINKLKPVFAGLAADITEENLQSRLRGVYLMALSNKFNKLLLTTGNKSELAVGYATLYGDMNGAYNPLKDLYKTEVYALAAWRNQNYCSNFKGAKGVVIAENILSKPASAELRPNQTDQDNLPPYEILDKILFALIEEEKSLKQICDMGYDATLVKNISELYYKAEFKRYQAPPGPKLSNKSFNRDRRYPLTNHFRDCGM